MQTLEAAWFIILTQPLTSCVTILLYLGFFASKMEIIIVPPLRGVVRIKKINPYKALRIVPAHSEQCISLCCCSAVIELLLDAQEQ